MYYHLSDHIYIAQFRNEFILLDIKQDVYTICFQQFSELLVKLLEEKQLLVQGISSSDLRCPSQDIDIIQKLVDDRVIQKKSTPYPFHIDRKPDSIGVSNVNWSLPLNSKNVSFNINVMRAIIVLTKVNIYMKTKGFYHTINLIKKNKKHKLKYTVPEDEELKDLAAIVNKACLIYPARTKCLEWAMTFVLLALRRKWKCNLEIGIQNHPFLAHAWVECDNKVVMDSQDLRDGLAIILNEPFRKLKI